MPFDDDVKSLFSWIPRVLRWNPPKVRIRGLWFGLFNPIFDDFVTAELYVCGTSRFSDGKCDAWATKPNYRPHGADSGSGCLQRIYSIAYPNEAERDAALGNDAEWSLCLAFSLFALHELLRSHTPIDFKSDKDRIGVAVGFDSGDFLGVGSLTPHGLEKKAL